MKGAVSALFSWSLRSDAVSFMPHVVRGGFALFVLLSVAMAVLDVFGVVGPGLEFFRSICFLNVVLITVAGMSYFVSAVTEEKDAGTLSLLILAGAPPTGILLSKSTSRLIGALMLLLIQMPFTFLAVTLGGVMWEQVLAAYLALAAWLCLVANAALLCSVISASSARAAGRATLLLVTLFVSDPALNALQAKTLPAWVPSEAPQAARWLQEGLQPLLVTHRLDTVLSPVGTTALTDRQFWWSLVLSAGLFLLSTLLFRRVPLSAPQSLSRSGRKFRRLTVSRAWKWFMLWKDFHFFYGGVPAIVARCIIYFGLIFVFGVLHRLAVPGSSVGLSHDLTISCFLLLLCALSVECLVAADGVLSQEIQQNALVLLHLLPIRPRWLLLQKLAAGTLSLIPGLLAMAVLFRNGSSSILSFVSPSAVVMYLFDVLLCVHLVLLLSLYSRWIALPVAVFLTLASNACFPFILLGAVGPALNPAGINEPTSRALIVTIVNVIWSWMFVLLPLEIQIARTWNRRAEQS